MLGGLFQGYSGWWSPPIHLNLSCTILHHLATSCSLAIFRVVWLVVLQILSRRSASNSLASRTTSRKNRVLRIAFRGHLFSVVHLNSVLDLDPPIHQIPEGKAAESCKDPPAVTDPMFKEIAAENLKQAKKLLKLLKLLTWLQLQNCWYFLVGKYGKCLKHYKARA